MTAPAFRRIGDNLFLGKRGKQAVFSERTDEATRRTNRRLNPLGVQLAQLVDVAEDLLEMPAKTIQLGIAFESQIGKMSDASCLFEGNLHGGPLRGGVSSRGRIMVNQPSNPFNQLTAARRLHKFPSCPVVRRADCGSRFWQSQPHFRLRSTARPHPIEPSSQSGHW